MGTLTTKTRNSELHIRIGLWDKSTSEDGTEKQAQIVSVIACVLESNIQKNEKLLKKSKTKDGGTMFHGTKAPTLNIKQYIERIFKYSKCSPSCFVVAYIYMERFIQSTNCYLTSLNVHRLLIASVLVATKFLEDVSYNNAYFAKVGGISKAEMNKLEVKLLRSLEYRLHVTVDTFDQWCLQLDKAAAAACVVDRRTCHIQRAIQTCSWLKKDESKCNPKFAGYTCGGAL